MTITKFGHSCLLVQEGNLRVLIDPGAYSTLQNEVKEIDVVLITHEHPDHFDLESLRIILQNNPAAKICTNPGVGEKLLEAKIAFEVLGDRKQVTHNAVAVEGVGEDHAVIYPGVPVVKNTGYFIAGIFFHPGDKLNRPMRPVEILALPVAAPWMKLADAIDYAKIIRPRVCFPIHDGMLKFLGPVHKPPADILKSLGIKFMVLEEGKEYGF